MFIFISEIRWIFSPTSDKGNPVHAWVIENRYTRLHALYTNPYESNSHTHRIHFLYLALLPFRIDIFCFRCIVTYYLLYNTISCLVRAGVFFFFFIYFTEIKKAI